MKILSIFRAISVLIVPYGIETSLQMKSSKHLVLVLIVPYGIETKQFDDERISENQY